MQIKAACVCEVGGNFVISPVEIDEPRSDEILVRIVGAGICHTDDVGRMGGFGSALPAVFGHEGSGIVERVGAQVTKVVPGDAVVLTFRSCGACDRCTAGSPSYCRQFLPLNFAGIRPDGSSTIRQGGAAVTGSFFGQSSFATYALAYETNVVKLDGARDLDIMGPLGCGVQTGAGAVFRSLDCKAGNALLVLGGGAVGLSAVMAAKVRGCAPIIVVEPSATRRALALELGASHAIDPMAGDVEAEVRQLAPGGVDVAIDTTGLASVLQAGLNSLAPLGVLGLIGIPAAGQDLLGLSASRIMSMGLTIRGVMEGDSNPDVLIPELVRLYREGSFPFDRLIRRYRFDEINRALADQHSGECLKAVLSMGE